MRKINTFWNWFQDNNQTIQSLIFETPANQKHISFWMSKNLGYYSKEIDFMIVFPINRSTKSELIITANGNPEYFKQVVDLIDNAPQLRNWKFTPFIQPTERIDYVINQLDKPFIFNEMTLTETEKHFQSLDDDLKATKIDTIIFLKNYNWFCNIKILRQTIFIILQNVPGENVLFQNIHLVQLSNQTEPITGVIHLYELPD